jgi:hypothetical protein
MKQDEPTGPDAVEPIADEIAEPTAEQGSPRVDRRTVLRRGAALSTLVWASPVVESLTFPAAADGKKKKDHDDDECDDDDRRYRNGGYGGDDDDDDDDDCNPKPSTPPPGSPKPCVIRFRVVFCKTYKKRVYKKGKWGWEITQKWFEVTLPTNISGECCDLLNKVIAAYQNGGKSESEFWVLLWKLIHSKCFDWEDWSCREIDPPGDDD